MPSSCGNIYIKNAGGKGVYLYANNAAKLPKILQAALRRGRERWGDTASLTRIIFSEMIQADILSNTGFGISANIMDNDNLILVVDDQAEKVGLFGESGRLFQSYSFTEFLNLSAANLDWARIAGGHTIAHDAGQNQRRVDPYVFG